VLRETELPKARENVLRVASGGPELLQEDGEKADEILVKLRQNVLDDVLFLDLRNQRRRKRFVAVEVNQTIELLADLIREIHRGLNSPNNLLTLNHSLAASRKVTNKLLTRVDRQTHRDPRLGCKCPANILKESSDLPSVNKSTVHRHCHELRQLPLLSAPRVVMFLLTRSGRRLGLHSFFTIWHHRTTNPGSRLERRISFPNTKDGPGFVQVKCSTPNRRSSPKSWFSREAIVTTRNEIS
jgi:hypothetical protein